LRKENSVLRVIGEVNLTFSRKDLIEAKRERERQRARLELTDKEVARINAKEQGRAWKGLKGGVRESERGETREKFTQNIYRTSQVLKFQRCTECT